jgi:hypothetical protein
MKDAIYLMDCNIDGKNGCNIKDKNDYFSQFTYEKVMDVKAGHPSQG